MAKCKSSWDRWFKGPNSWLCRVLKICCSTEDEYVDVDICTTSGKLARPCCYDEETVITEKFKDGDQPTLECPWPDHQMNKPVICSTSGDLANDWCIKAGTDVPTSMCVFKKPTEKCAIHHAPPPPIPKIPEDMTVNALRKRFGYPVIISQYFNPTFFIENEDTFDEDYIEKNLIDRVASKVHANAKRAFIFGGWEPETFKMISSPWKKDGDSFKLGSKNQKHVDRLKRRTSWDVKRNITPMISLIDNCSMHIGRPGWWNKHAWNGYNNVNGTSTWQPSVYHFYEAEHMDKPGMRETAKWVEDYIRWIVREMEMEFSGQLIWEITNEGRAGYGYNKMVRGWMKEEGVKENWRVMTSLDKTYWDSYGKQMNSFLNYSIHGVQTLEAYEDRKKYFKSGVRFLPSEDGEQPLNGSNAKYKALVKRILEDGNLGFELNSRPFYYGRDYKKWIEDTNTWSRMKAISDAWKAFLDSK